MYPAEGEVDLPCVGVCGCAGVRVCGCAGRGCMYWHTNTQHLLRNLLRAKVLVVEPERMSIHMSINMSIHMSIHMSLHMSTHTFAHMSI